MGVRILTSYGLGVLFGVFVIFLFNNVNNYSKIVHKCLKLSTSTANSFNYIYSAEHWQVKIKKPVLNNIQNPQQPKVVFFCFNILNLTNLDNTFTLCCY